MLTPCFGTWTFGPAALNNESTSNLNYKISVSYKHTWVTFGISVIGAIVTSVVGYEYEISRDFSYPTYVSRDWVIGAVLISGVLMIVILPILIGFVQGVDKCCNSLCTITVTDLQNDKVTVTKCFPVVERTKLDVDNMD